MTLFFHVLSKPNMESCLETNIPRWYKLLSTWLIISWWPLLDKGCEEYLHTNVHFNNQMKIMWTIVVQTLHFVAYSIWILCPKNSHLTKMDTIWLKRTRFLEGDVWYGWMRIPFLCISPLCWRKELLHVSVYWGASWRATIST